MPRGAGFAAEQDKAVTNMSEGFDPDGINPFFAEKGRTFYGVMLHPLDDCEDLWVHINPLNLERTETLKGSFICPKIFVHPDEVKSTPCDVCDNQKSTFDPAKKSKFKRTNEFIMYILNLKGEPVRKKVTTNGRDSWEIVKRENGEEIIHNPIKIVSIGQGKDQSNWKPLETMEARGLFQKRIWELKWNDGSGIEVPSAHTPDEYANEEFDTEVPQEAIDQIAALRGTGRVPSDEFRRTFLRHHKGVKWDLLRNDVGGIGMEPPADKAGKPEEAKTSVKSGKASKNL